MSVPPARVLRLVLGDQLSLAHPWFANPDPDVVYVLAELRQELEYVAHHVQKVVAFFDAMGEFARQIEADGHSVLHLDLAATAEVEDLPALLKSLISASGAERFEY